MFTSIALKRVALVLVLGAAVVAAAEAQTIPPNFRRATYCAGGMFTLTGGIATFHVALDDNPSEPSVFVVLRFIDQKGTVVKATGVSIGPGGSASLQYQGTGLYRVQAETFESAGSAYFSDRRNVVTSLEISVDVGGPDGTVSARLIGPGPWAPCVALKH
jgi:hypothetical protein